VLLEFKVRPVCKVRPARKVPLELEAARPEFKALLVLRG
jgi:hypothetical protein